MAEESGVKAFQKQNQILPSLCSGCSAIASLRTTSRDGHPEAGILAEGSGVGFQDPGTMSFSGAQDDNQIQVFHAAQDEKKILRKIKVSCRPDHRSFFISPGACLQCLQTASAMYRKGSISRASLEFRFFPLWRYRSRFSETYCLTN